MAETIAAIGLRPVAEQDREFLCAVYASTRTEELAQVPWTDQQKAAFLRSQFEAQDRHYRLHYGDGTFSVITVDGVDGGRLIVHSSDVDISIVDIALLPENRRHGLGERILRSILEDGDRTGRPISIHVERNNPALRLYERLGFRLAEDKGVYLFLVRAPVS